MSSSLRSHGLADSSRSPSKSNEQLMPSISTMRGGVTALAVPLLLEGVSSGRDRSRRSGPSSASQSPAIVDAEFPIFAAASDGRDHGVGLRRVFAESRAAPREW